MTPKPVTPLPTKRWIDVPPQTLVLRAVSVSAIAFAAILTSTWVIATMLQAKGATVDPWTVLGNVSAAAAVSITIGGGLLLWAQLVQSHRERSRAAFTEAFMLLMQDEQIEARRWVYGLPDDVAAAHAEIIATDENRARYKRVVNTLDYLGFLVVFHPGADDEVIRWTSPIVRKTWAKLGPVIDDEARRREEPDYYAAARALAARCAARDRQVGGEVDAGKWVEGAL